MTLAEKLLKNCATRLYGLSGKQDMEYVLGDMTLSVKYNTIKAEPKVVPKCKLSIKVNDDKNMPVKGAIVKLIGTESYLSRPTGKRGGASMSVLADFYEVIVEAKGYKLSETLPKIDISSDQEFEIKLEKIE